MIFSGELLCELYLHYIRPCPSSVPEPMEDTMELETGSYTGVYERLYHLTEGLHDSYAPGVHGPFGYKEQDSPPW